MVALHSFDWFRDLDACGDHQSQDLMQRMTMDWLRSVGRFNEATRAVAFRHDVIGQRLWVFLVWFRFLTFRHKTLERLLWQSMNDQAEHLYHQIIGLEILNPSQALSPISSRWPHPIIATLRAYKGLLAWFLCLPSANEAEDREITKILASFETVLPLILLPDGGTVSRNPSLILSCLREFCDIRDTMMRANYPLPPLVVDWIDKLAPALRFFRHSDGGLALFQGGSEVNSADIELVLQRCGTIGQAPLALPSSCFVRVASHSLILLCDSGARERATSSRVPPSLPTHSSLAIEFSSDGERIVTNIGGYPELEPRRQRLIKNSASYSTQVVEEAAAAQSKPANGKPLQPDSKITAPVAEAPQAFDNQIPFGTEAQELPIRHDSTDGVWLIHQSNRLSRTHNALQQRHLWVSPLGDAIKGRDFLISTLPEDSLTKVIGGELVLRFHLHPTVLARAETVPRTLVRIINLMLPSGRSWQFLTTDANISLSDYEYFGIEGEIRQGQQIVIRRSITSLPQKIQWQFRRVKP